MERENINVTLRMEDVNISAKKSSIKLFVCAREVTDGLQTKDHAYSFILVSEDVTEVAASYAKEMERNTIVAVRKDTKWTRGTGSLVKKLILVSQKQEVDATSAASREEIGITVAVIKDTEFCPTGELALRFTLAK